MKTIIWVAAGFLVLAILLGGAGLVYAQSADPGDGYGPGMMGRGARWGGYGMMGAAQGAYGPMHEYMVAALAEALNLTPADVQDRLSAGETPWEIAASTGLSDDQVRDLLVEVHNTALDQAVAAGVITQAQADWMKDHMQGRWASGAGFGGCHGGRWSRP